MSAADCYVPFGTAWNRAAGRASDAWQRADARVCVTIEVTYADTLGMEMNGEAARAFGRDLARAILQTPRTMSMRHAILSLLTLIVDRYVVE